MSKHKSGLKIFTESGFFRVPTFFITELMYQELSKGIPPVFWKLTLVVWQKVMKPTPQKDDKGRQLVMDGKPVWVFPYDCDITEQQWQDEFGIGDEASRKFTRAYSVSGLFEIRHGYRNNLKVTGVPTIWKYKPGIGKRDWTYFIAALRNVCARTGRTFDLDEFTLDLALEVDRVRTSGLPEVRLAPVNEKHIVRLRATVEVARKERERLRAEVLSRY